MSEEVGFPPIPPIPGFSYSGYVICTTCKRKAAVFYQRVEDWHSTLLEMCPTCQHERAKRDPVSGL